MARRIQRNTRIVFLSEADDCCLWKICDELAPATPKNLIFHKVCGVQNFVQFGKEKFFILNRIGGRLNSLVHNWLLSLMEDPSKRFVYFIDDAIDYRNDNLPWKFMEKATAILVPTKSMKEYLIEKNSDIANKIAVVRTHINLKLLAHVAPLARIDDRIQIMWGGGGLTGLPIIKDIITYLDQKRKDVRLFCVGAKIGLVRTYLEPVRNIDIRYFEFLPYKDFVSICKASLIHLNPLCPEEANILVHDLKDPEAFIRVKAPIKFIHAGEAQKVLITTAIPSYEEVVVHGENGFLARKKDEWIDLIDYLLDNPDRIEDIGKKARQAVEEKFDTSLLVDQYLQVYLGDEYEKIVMEPGIS